VTNYAVCCRCQFPAVTVAVHRRSAASAAAHARSLRLPRSAIDRIDIRKLRRELHEFEMCLQWNGHEANETGDLRTSYEDDFCSKIQIRYSSVIYRCDSLSFLNEHLHTCRLGPYSWIIQIGWSDRFFLTGFVLIEIRIFKVQTQTTAVIWHLSQLANSTVQDNKLSYRRGTARCVVSVEILPIATQQCRNYLYDKS